MVKHIVLFKFMEEKKTSDMNTLIEKLRKLPEKIDLIRSYEVGANVVEGPRNYDVGLVSTFDTLADLKAYATCDPHTEFIEYMKTCVEDVKVLDFEY